MTLIYVHGVKVRDPAHGEGLRKSFLRWLGPKLKGDATVYAPVFWGDRASDFRWGLASRPKTKLLHAGGAARFDNVGLTRAAPTALERPAAALAPAEAEGPVIGAPVAAGPAPLRLGELAPGRRPDFLADLYLGARAPTVDDAAAAVAIDPVAETPETAGLAAVADAVAQRWDAVTAQAASDDVRLELLLTAVQNELEGSDLIAAGGFEDWVARAAERLRRVVSGPGDLISTALAEVRPIANEFVANFVGDVFVYLKTRERAGGAPGEVPTRVLDALKAAHRRKQAEGGQIVIVTHSMGGQLVYDALNHFAPRDPELQGLEIDHWFSCGAQVSFFAELGLFLSQPDLRGPRKLAKPANVRTWVNFYDPNDLVGFIMAPVFDGVTDVEYDTGYGLALAHTGFLARPSFFEEMAARV